MEDKLAEMVGMWTTDKMDWILVRFESGYLPVNRAGYAMLIEIDELSEEVCRRMLEAGCEVVDIKDVGPAFSESR